MFKILVLHQFLCCFIFLIMSFYALGGMHGSILGPSIYDFHMEGGRGSGSGGRMWTGGGGQPLCGRPHRKLKLESTDVILSSFHAKKLASFLPEFRLWTGKKWKFFCDIN